VRQTSRLGHIRIYATKRRRFLGLLMQELFRDSPSELRNFD